MFVPLVIFFVLLIFLFAGAADTSRLFPGFSLRYDAEIDGKAALAARQYSIEETAGQAEEKFWPTFWREDKGAMAESETGSAACLLISYSGDGVLALNAEFLRGAMPGPVDEIGCAISDKLAHSLFGSTDIVGMTVYIDEEKRICRGVFKDAQSLALLSCGDMRTDFSWQVAELSGGGADASKTTASNFGVSSGLGRPPVVLDGRTFSMWAKLACLIPIIIVILFIVIRLLMQLRRPLRAITIFAVCLGVALFLPVILGQLPGWVVPDMWSDFSFWSSLAADFDNSLREFFGMKPYMRDVEGKLLLLRQLFLCSAAVVCAVALCILSVRQLEEKTNGKHHS